MTATLQQLMGK